MSYHIDFIFPHENVNLISLAYNSLYITCLPFFFPQYTCVNFDYALYDRSIPLCCRRIGGWRRLVSDRAGKPRRFIRATRGKNPHCTRVRYRASLYYYRTHTPWKCNLRICETNKNRVSTL